MKAKKSYQRPEIKKVNLVPQEAVLTICKAASGTAKNAGRTCRSTGCINNTVGS